MTSTFAVLELFSRSFCVICVASGVFYMSDAVERKGTLKSLKNDAGSSNQRDHFCSERGEEKAAAMPCFVLRNALAVLAASVKTIADIIVRTE